MKWRLIVVMFLGLRKQHESAATHAYLTGLSAWMYGSLCSVLWLQESCNGERQMYTRGTTRVECSPYGTQASRTAYAG